MGSLQWWLEFWKIALFMTPEVWIIVASIACMLAVVCVAAREGMK